MTRAKNGAGTVECREGQWFGRVVLSDGSRPRFPLGKGVATEEEARTRVTNLVERGRATGRLDDMVLRLVGPRTASARRKAAQPNMTVRELAEAWTSGRLFRDYGAQASLKPSTASDRINWWTLSKSAFPVKTRGVVGPAFGDLRVADVEVADITAVMGAQKGAAETRKHMYSRLRRLFDLAEFPVGVRKVGTNPVLTGHRPPKDPDRLYLFLYPSEVLALLGCTQIPLGRRVLYLLATYFGWRKGTLYAFRWSGIDEVHGTVSVLFQKGQRRVDGADSREAQGRPIFFVAEPSVLHVLRAWRKRLGEPPKESPVVVRVGLDRRHDERKVLHEDLRLAGVRRELLFSTAPNVMAIRFHDLRATFCTWARRMGKDGHWICERSGHTPSGPMLDRYTRQAVTFADLNYQPFPDVTHAIPELAPPDPGSG